MQPDLAAAVRKARGNASGGAEQKQSAVEETWPAIDEAAFHGLAGDIVRAIDPHTEADRVAMLGQLLAYFGNVIGRSPLPNRRRLSPSKHIRCSRR